MDMTGGSCLTAPLTRSQMQKHPGNQDACPTSGVQFDELDFCAADTPRKAWRPLAAAVHLNALRQASRRG